MALSTWLTLRQANEALRGGRPDEAHRLVEPLAAEGYRKAIRLLPAIAIGYVARGQRHLRADNPEAAWADLLAAEGLNPTEPAAVRLRDTLARLGLAICRAALEAGHPIHVLETAARLTDRGVSGPELDRLVTAAREWGLAAEQASRGDFSLATTTLTRTKANTDPHLTPGMDRFLHDLARRQDRFRTAVGELEQAIGSSRWKEAVQWADEATAVAPEAREVRSLRAKAWAALQPDAAIVEEAPILLAEPVGVGSAYAPTKAFPPVAVARATKASPPAPPASTQPLPKRFLLWVDNVGGYLVCLNPRVTFGQAVAEGPVDVPLFAELSKLHAELVRDAEGYVLESTREVLVNGQPAPRTILRPGDRLTLGPACQLVFHQPVPISPSARLELVSGHRLPHAVDGVLLMAEALILGCGEQVHVPLPDGVGPIVLYRTKDGLGVRCPGDFRVDDRPCHDRCDLPLPSVVTAERFTFALEPVGPRL